MLGVAWDVTDQVRQDERQLELQTQLRDVSHQAGMAEVATGVLHSIGNVLNSLGVSTTLVLASLRDSRIGNVQRIAKLLAEQGDRVGTFFETDPRGSELPGYLAQLGDHLGAENRTLVTELQRIVAHVEHIGKIVVAQQSYARRGGITEEVDVAELVDNAIALNFTGSTDVTINRDYQIDLRLTLDRHKVIQILGNLLSNSHHALREQTQGSRALTVRIRAETSSWLVIEIEDSGVGIEAYVQWAVRSNAGFTTKIAMGMDLVCMPARILPKSSAVSSAATVTGPAAARASVYGYLQQAPSGWREGDERERGAGISQQNPHSRHRR